VRDLELGGYRAKLAEKWVARTRAGKRLLPFPEGNGHQPGPLL